MDLPNRSGMSGMFNPEPGVQGPAGVWLTEWVPLSRRCPEQAHQHLGGEADGAQGTQTGEAKQVVPRSKPPRRCQAAEETRGPQSGRAQEGRRAPDEIKKDLDPVDTKRLRLRLGG
jgi:hypothetical protein